jgi:hypothetical protein
MRHELRGRRELRVKFYGFEDLAALMFELANAMINDMDHIRAQVEEVG